MFLNCKISDGKGFSLIEVLISITILAMIITSVWASVFSTAKTKEAIERKDDFQQMVRVVLDRLTRDLQLAFLIPQARRKTGFVGKDNKLTFSTFSHQVLDPKHKECEQTIVTYTLERDEKRPQYYVLTRKEDRFLQDEFGESKGKSIELLPGIKELKIEYYDGEKFSEDWDHESIETRKKDKIPSAVKINLDVVDEREALHNYYTMVNIPLSKIELSHFNPPSVPKTEDTNKEKEKQKDKDKEKKKEEEENPETE